MDRIRPVKPPIVNTNRKPIANSIGVSKLSAPRHMVATQLNTFTPVGTAISMVAYMKNNWPVTGMPVANMWCAQTMNERMAIDAVAYTIEAIAEQGLARKRRDDLRDDPERGQDHDVHLRVSEEPEDVLVHDRIGRRRPH